MTIKMTEKRKNLGFTLVELMITVSVMAILSGVLLQVINPQELRKKTRDQQRIADLKRIQTALELYYADKRAYPPQANFGAIPAELVNYINPIPQDPKTSTYLYRVVNGDYCLLAQMEVDTSAQCLSTGSGDVCEGAASYTNAYCVVSP